MLKIAVCDDEQYMQEELENRIKEFFLCGKQEINITRFSDGASILNFRGEWDIIFLDIQMDTISGMETAKALRKQGFTGFLIFVTVLRECVFESFEVGAYDFLVKPLDVSYFTRVMKRLCEEKQQQKSFLVVQKNKGCIRVAMNEILFCEVINRKIYLHTCKGKIIDYYEKMEELENKLNGNFFRCHRSFLINLQFVQGYKNGMAYFREGTKVPVSRQHSKEFLEAMLQYMKK